MARARWDNHVPSSDNLSAEDVYRRMLEDRRGVVVREGCTYRATVSAGVICVKVIPWNVRHTVRGRVDQYDIVVAGAVWMTGGGRALSRYIKRISG